jgi:4'-phosphopantetheinyl transferase
MIASAELHAPADSFALENGVLHVWRGSLNQPLAIRHRLESLLSDDEHERALRFHFDKDRARYVVGRGLLRLLLARYTGLDAACIGFDYGRHQKPVLAGAETPFFNLAHAGTIVLYVFSSCFPVGVDVELMQPELPGEGIAEHFFSPLEVATLRSLPKHERGKAFLACWTRKEAFLKARGDGLTLALDSFDVTLAPDEPAALLRTEWSPDEHLGWKLLDISDPESAQVAALAAPEPEWQCVARDIDISSFVLD